MRHRIIDDALRERRQAVRGLGGDFAPPLDDPASMVAALGCRPRATWSIVGHAVEAGAMRMPRWLLNSLLRSLRDGLCVHAFAALPLGAGASGVG